MILISQKSKYLYPFLWHFLVLIQAIITSLLSDQSKHNGLPVPFLPHLSAPIHFHSTSWMSFLKPFHVLHSLRTELKAFKTLRGVLSPASFIATTQPLALGLTAIFSSEVFVHAMLWPRSFAHVVLSAGKFYPLPTLDLPSFHLAHPSLSLRF